MILQFPKPQSQPKPASSPSAGTPLPKDNWREWPFYLVVKR